MKRHGRHEGQPLRATLVGHACIFCEMDEMNIMIDPNLKPSFREGSFGFSPARRCRTERIPSPHLVLLSHRHRDHFDISSLNELPQDCLVVHPADPLIEHVLERLGFKNRRQINDWDRIEIASELAVLATPSLMSRSQRGEVGYVICHHGRTVWDLADSVVTPVDISMACSILQRVDLAFYPFQPMLQAEFVQNRVNSFPIADYGAVLRGAMAIAPRLLVPASCGYAVHGANAWINRFKFPIGRQRFCRDLQQIAPWIETSVLEPGDVVELDPEGAWAVRRQAATRNFVEAAPEDDPDIDFNPTAEVAALTEPARGCAHTNDLRQQLACLLSHWRKLLERERDRWDLWHRWKLTYELQVVLPDRVDRIWIDFSNDPARVGEAGLPPADFTLSCTASTLLGLAAGTLHFDHQLGGAIRTFSCFYRPTVYGVAGHRDLIPEYSEEKLGAFGLLHLLVDWDGLHEQRVLDHQLDHLSCREQQ